MSSVFYTSAEEESRQSLLHNPNIDSSSNDFNNFHPDNMTISSSHDAIVEETSSFSTTQVLNVGDYENSSLTKKAVIVICSYSLLTFCQGFFWAIAGPLALNYSTLYDVTFSDISMMINLGPIVFIPLSLPFAVLMDKGGQYLRGCMIFSCVVVFIGQMIRQLTLNSSDSSRSLLFLSYFLNSAAGPVACSISSKLSNLFVSPKYRVFSTSIMTQANLLGGAGAQLIGPLIVTEASFDQLRQYNWVLFCFALPMLLVSFLFPTEPDIAPSKSAALAMDADSKMTLRLFLGSIPKLLSNKNFLLLALSYGLTTGAYGAWATILSMILEECKASVTSVISYSSSLGGALAGLLIGRISMGYELKKVLILCLSISGVSFLLFAILASTSIPICDHYGAPLGGFAALMILALVASSALNSTMPLFFELSLEEAWPLPAACIGTMLANFNNVGALILLSLPPASYLNYLQAFFLIGSTLVLFFLYTPSNNRHAVDDEKVLISA